MWSAGAAALAAAPMRWLVGAPAGSVPDVMNRELARRMAQVLGQTIVVENRPGGAGVVVMRELMRSAPDGLTVAATFSSQLCVTPSIITPAPYEPVADFTHLGLWSHGYTVLAATTESGLRSVADVLAAGRREPGRMQIGTPGAGTPPHLALALLSVQASVEFGHVHFRAPDLMSAALRNDVPLIADGVQLMRPHIAAGKLRPLAVLAPKRLAALPEVPTMTESGVPGVEASTWHGVVGPRGMPHAWVARFNEALRDVGGMQSFQAWNEEAGRQVDVSTPQQMHDAVQEDYRLWKTVVQRAKITLS
jgi:tripartite-type tricarboxylate transporter receptor subunit TctC